MPTVKLPNGDERHFEHSMTIRQIVEEIGAGLARAALAAKVDGQLVDLSYIVAKDITLQIITDKDREGLEIIRHSTAHLLAHAVKELYPETQVTIGPVVENGFYYDFARDESFTPEDLVAIEEKMKEIAKQDLPVTRTIMQRDEAIHFFRNMGEEYKARIIEEIPRGEILSAYQQGDFIDLCRGPHVPSTGRLKAFKLTKLAGAYWRGDSNNEMLQRIYGTAWESSKALKAYLEQLEEAEKRDHRKLAKNLDLFHITDGMVYWHPNGWTIYNQMQRYIRDLLQKNAYLEIRTPQLVDIKLWQQSGHVAKFNEEMYVLHEHDHHYAIKPMSCPCHVQVYNQNIRSYRDLPLRFSEFGCCHRKEPSGTLHGLMRVRQLEQDDAHIFCTEEQIESEVADFTNLLYQVYSDFGFNDITVKLATRPDKRVGADHVWDKAELALEHALRHINLEFDMAPGEGAFYGPKLEFHLRDCIGRVWQCGTIQVDFSMPARLGATYIAEDGTKQTPVMLHRAILGSFERFMGILLEHYAGKLPVWLAPNQVVIMTITEQHVGYGKRVNEMLRMRGYRSIVDLRNEKIGFKIREHTLNRVPFLIVVGQKEIETDTLAVRSQEGHDLGTMTLDVFCQHLAATIAKRGRANL